MSILIISRLPTSDGQSVNRRVAQVALVAAAIVTHDHFNSGAITPNCWRTE
ncbi:hypothetical protein FHR20_001233 [Sphingomonas leidyi]|uniref:Uncharacterized protein n=1 Tax=Sphingomonas leidyi TaxID=68569 RepID=A0A7X5ZUP4_9SPHN|nr:hypothetical protein [Sphingomonas leidyi]NIJ64302.1 hypothetical protein [Sphingomonas leidyi]